MKAKPTWRPRGLRAKKWREAGQERGYQLPQPKASKDKILFRKGETR